MRSIKISRHSVHYGLRPFSARWRQAQDMGPTSAPRAAGQPGRFCSGQAELPSKQGPYDLFRVAKALIPVKSQRREGGCGFGIQPKAAV